VNRTTEADVDLHKDTVIWLASRLVITSRTQCRTSRSDVRDQAAVHINVNADARTVAIAEGGHPSAGRSLVISDPKRISRAGSERPPKATWHQPGITFYIPHFPDKNDGRTRNSAALRTRPPRRRPRGGRTDAYLSCKL